MKIPEKLKLDFNGLVEHGPINIVAFGDSVTHGAVGKDEIDYESVYWNRLKKKINEVNNYVPVNVINAGIGGITATGSLERVERQVLAHNPDLIIVCFGLNDVVGELNDYLSSLRIIFEKGKKAADVIFMTPNMLNTNVAADIEPELEEFAKLTAEIQNSGKMDKYIYSAVDLAKSMGIKVCDCYSEWKKLSETQNTTLLLANRVNHPVREMHELFAQRLFECIFE